MHGPSRTVPYVVNKSRFTSLLFVVLMQCTEVIFAVMDPLSH
jgi:hypothetical protein